MDDVKLIAGKISNEKDALLCESSGIDFITFDFYPRSFHFMPMHWVKKIVSSLSNRTGIITEFVNEKPGVIDKVMEETSRVDFLLFSGYETPEECEVYSEKSLIRFFHNDEMTVENLDTLFSFKNEYFMFSWGDLVNMNVLREMLMKRMEAEYRKLIISIMEEKMLTDSELNPLDLSPFAVEIGSVIRTSQFSRNVEADKLKFLLKRFENWKKGS